MRPDHESTAPRRLLSAARCTLAVCIVFGAALFSPLSASASGVSTLLPDSGLFENGSPLPVRSRFLPEQTFDLVAVVQPEPGRTIVDFEFYVDGKPTRTRPSIAADKDKQLGDCTTASDRDAATAPCMLWPDHPGAPVVLAHPRYAHAAPGIHAFKLVAWQDDGSRLSANGNFEILDAASAPALAGSATALD